MLLHKYIMILKRIIIKEVEIIFERLDAFRLASRGEYHNNRIEMRNIQYKVLKTEYTGFIADRCNLRSDRVNVSKDIVTAFDKIKLTYKL
ncbi:MAG: hypothetical protein R3Y16_05165 [Rikenellaceae bacterium]